MRQFRLDGGRVGQRALERLERGRFHLLQVGEPLRGLLGAPLALLGFGALGVAPGLLARGQRGFGRLHAGNGLGCAGLVSKRRGGRLRVLPHAPHALPHVARAGELRLAGQRLERRGQLGQLRQALGHGRLLGALVLGGAQRRVEVGLQLGAFGMFHHGQSFPLCHQQRLRLWCDLRAQGATSLDQRPPRRQPRGAFALLLLAGGALGVQPRLGLAHDTRGLGDPGIEVVAGIGAFGLPPRQQRRQPRRRLGRLGAGRQLLRVPHQLELGAPVRLARRRRGRFGAGGRGRLFLEGALHDPCPPGRRRVGRPGGDRLDRRPVGYPLEGRRRDVAKRAAQRRAGQFLVVVHARQRLQAYRGMLAAPRDGGQRLLILAQPAQRGLADALAPRRLGHQHELLLRRRRRQRGQRLERGQAGGLVGVKGPQRDVQQHAGCLVAHRLVAVGAEDLGQRPDRAEFADRHLAHARVRVGTCDLRQHVLLVFGQLTHAGQPDLRIGVFPFRLCLESVEDAHGYGGRASRPMSGGSGTGSLSPR